MRTVGVAASVLIILWFLFEAFEAMVLTRRITRPFRFTVYYFRGSWWVWRRIARVLGTGKRRDNFLALFGPLSILALIIIWIAGLITGFALLHLSLGTKLNTPAGPDGLEDFGVYLYLSGVTFFTLGFGEVTAREPFGRLLTVIEAGVGFMFLAVSIGYLPVFYSLFTRREVVINLLDARAGSPPSAGQVLLRAGRAQHISALNSLLADGERWSAELLEGCLSYPVLAYYRSQHDNQSWLATLTTLLDTCALLITSVKDADSYQAQLTFAMARHAVVDLALVFHLPPRDPDPNRLPPAVHEQLRTALLAAGVTLRDGPAVEARLAELRATYEPFLTGLSGYFLFPLPSLFSEKQPPDNWQTSAWMRRTAGIGRLPGTEPDDHE
jgi:voltage-gated potassium channel Kch